MAIDILLYYFYCFDQIYATEVEHKEHKLDPTRYPYSIMHFIGR